jgi:hypothetical protein
LIRGLIAKAVGPFLFLRPKAATLYFREIEVRSLALIPLLLLLPLPGFAAQDVWKVWHAELRRRCPANHVELISDPNQLDLIDAFTRTLPAVTQSRASAMADTTVRCSAEKMGFYCEMAAYLDAFKKLGILDRFATFACHRYKCAEAALCTVTEH